MPTDLAPGLYIEDVDLGERGISALRTDVAAFVGIAERGPLDEPTPIASWEQFESTFGGFVGAGYLAYTVKAFFENDGLLCRVVRVAAPPVTTTSDPASPQPVDRLSSLVLSVSGFARGAAVTVRQDQLVREHLVEGIRPPDRLVWTERLEAEFVLDDPPRPLHFDTGAAAAATVLRDANGQEAVRLEASSPGSWANGMRVRCTTSYPAATRTSSQPQPGDRFSSIVLSTAGFERGAVVRIFQDGMAAPQCRVVAAVDAVAGRLTWDFPLAAYNAAAPLSLETVELALDVYRGGRLREQHAGLSLGPAHARYVAKLDPRSADAFARPSRLLRVLDARSGDPSYLHVAGAAELGSSVATLVSGRDGAAALRPVDFAGDIEIETKHGLRVLEDVDDVSVVAIPDILVQPTQPVVLAPPPEPAPDACALDASPPRDSEPFVPRVQEAAPTLSLEEIFGVQRALVTHCETLKDRIALIDAPFSPHAGVVDFGEIRAWKQRFDSSFAALPYPWVLVYDPLRIGGAVVRPVPPSGHVAGVIARTDNREGVHRAPANEELRWAQGATLEITAEMQGALNPLGINCIRTFPGRGLRIYGARTISSDPSLRYLSVRRLLLMIEQALRRSLQWAVFEPDDVYLRQTIALGISAFLRGLWQRGALVGPTPADAFRVNCGEEINPPALSAAGRLLAEVKVAPVRPAEFVVFRIGRTRDELEIVE